MEDMRAAEHAVCNAANSDPWVSRSLGYKSAVMMFNRLSKSLFRKRNDSPKEVAPYPQQPPAPAVGQPPPGPRDPFAKQGTPPAYSPPPPGVAARRPDALPEDLDHEDTYDFLKSFDTIFLIDDSGSTAGSRWPETALALKTNTPICTAHDADGIDIYFLNHLDEDSYHSVRDTATLRDIFGSVHPGGRKTSFEGRLGSILSRYLRKYESDPHGTKPINVICTTKGIPTGDIERAIISTAKKLDKLDAPPWQVRIQFMQIDPDNPSPDRVGSGLRCISDREHRGSGGLDHDKSQADPPSISDGPAIGTIYTNGARWIVGKVRRCKPLKVESWWLKIFLLLSLHGIGGVNGGVIVMQKSHGGPPTMKLAGSTISTTEQVHFPGASDPTNEAWKEMEQLVLLLTPLVFFIAGGGALLWRHFHKPPGFPSSPPTWLCYLTVAASLAWIVLRNSQVKDPVAIEGAFCLWAALGANMAHSFFREVRNVRKLVGAISLVTVSIVFILAALQTMSSGRKDSSMELFAEHAKDWALLILSLTAWAAGERLSQASADGGSPNPDGGSPDPDGMLLENLQR